MILNIHFLVQDPDYLDGAVLRFSVEDKMRLHDTDPVAGSDVFGRSASVRVQTQVFHFSDQQHVVPVRLFFRPFGCSVKQYLLQILNGF